MRRCVPPLNQRRLNTRIKQVYGRKYRDWYHMALELEGTGMKRDEIVQAFSAIGVPISTSTLIKWMQVREKIEARNAA